MVRITHETSMEEKIHNGGYYRKVFNQNHLLWTLGNSQEKSFKCFHVQIIIFLKRTNT